LFVVLLVVFSLVLTAGTVVFVNQTENFQAALTTTKAQLAQANQRADLQQEAAAAAEARAQESVRQASQQLEDAKRNLNGLQQALLQKEADLATARLQNSVQQASVESLTGALKGSEDVKSRMQEQLTELRTTADRLTKQNQDLNYSVTDLTNRLDVTERERKLLAEQNTELRTQVDKQASALQGLGYSQAKLAAAGPRFGAPPINGVIRDVRTIQGVPYAAISVGSADSVTAGMEFKVVARDTGTFLGVLKVDSVEQNESTGRLEGPRVAEIKPGAEVKTQL
jgi:multidrug efflux pump subunit AcrA (membrane-fusion protein)